MKTVYYSYKIVFGKYSKIVHVLLAGADGLVMWMEQNGLIYYTSLIH